LHSDKTRLRRFALQFYFAGEAKRLYLKSHMETQIHFIRHGESDWNAEGRIQGHAESKLSNLGIKQAQKAKERLSAFDFNKIYSSDLIRAKQTVQIINANMNIEIEYLSDLREIKLGPWEGKLISEVKERNPKEHDAFWNFPHEFNLDGAETYKGLQKRGIQVIDRIIKECTGSLALVVSHGALIQTILNFYEGRQLSEIWACSKMSNCSHNVLEFSANNPVKIVRYQN